MSDLLSGLNDRQKEAVLAGDGPVLILAGAGSGKTRALTHRIAYLIRERGVSSNNILAVTFTNKAAKEMAQRVEILLRSSEKNSTKGRFFMPYLGTFHAICVKILRREIDKYSSRGSNFTIYDQSDSLNAVKQAMRKLNISEKSYNPRAIRSFISSAKSELIDDKDYKKYAFEHFQEIVSQVYSEYQKILRSGNALDFDDLLMVTVEILEANPPLLQEYQEIFKYILIDEYQDTNHAQYRLVKNLAQKYRNIFAIGDDWQSIYSFRGAKFQNILDFQKDYADAKIIYLEENYRSTEPILQAAQSVIKNNEVRSDKNLFTKNSSGAPVTVISSEEKLREVDFILDEINSLCLGEGRRYSDFAILYRTNAQSRPFEEALVRRAIPYRIYGSIKFYERKEVKDIIAYLNYLQNPNDLVSLSRIVNVPARGIGEKTLSKIIASPQDAKNIEKYASFLKLIDQIKEEIVNLVPQEAIERVIEKTRYREFINDGTIESQSRLENLEELKAAASSYEKLNDFLQNAALVSDVDKHGEEGDVLTLMTVHLSKGLEFPVVFISGLEEGLLPHSQSLDDQIALEEERRLFYVAMTRAMERLYILHSRCRFVYGSFQYSMPSRFIDELPESIDSLEI
ncbi:MAG: ATP-dependent DNA helicase PcrA [candidate division WS2 bacterium ADurb.Bin280]|uniref:DNA 3'-5' helicase n=1 Tax=candidate division WS2 bacterium ADurb.Bin280 TaxID=1852829 RepID=A0A1V5SEP7_9BACT|nr:MAG: ATP-dependent DNA helicase PcrA [candidate division WS2 bacterium ADurb.Bin280]